MARYGQVFKERAVGQLLPPESKPVEQLSREIGVSVTTLERWRAEAMGNPGQTRKWTAAARLEAVIVTAALDAERSGAWCREHGVYPEELASWRESAVAALAEPGEAVSQTAQGKLEQKKIRELERDLDRKNKALAETTALLVLAKKLSAIFPANADE